jgi:precorrin-3B methylase
MMPAHIRWLAELQALAARYGAALGADLAALSLAELWGVYAFLRAWTERAG